MSDKSKNNPEVLEKGGISRRNFLGASAVTGAAVAATAFGGAVMTRESWAAAVRMRSRTSTSRPASWMTITVSGAAATRARCACWAFRPCAS